MSKMIVYFAVALNVFNLFFKYFEQDDFYFKDVFQVIEGGINIYPVLLNVVFMITLIVFYFSKKMDGVLLFTSGICLMASGVVFFKLFHFDLVFGGQLLLLNFILIVAVFFLKFLKFPKSSSE